jgi:hypothetical protein
VLCWIFGAAVLSKVSSRRRWSAFVEALPALGLPGRVPAGLAAAAVIAGEAGALATLAAVPRLGAVISAGLLVVFIAALAAAVRGNRRTSCHCFGSSDAPVGRSHIVRNLLLLAASGVVLRAPATPVALSAAGLAALGYGALIGFVMTRWDDLVFLLGKTRVLPRSAEDAGPAPGGP